MVSFESTGGSDTTIQVLETAGSLQVVIVLSKPINQQVTVFVIATDISATGLLNVFCILTVLISCSFSWW